MDQVCITIGEQWLGIVSSIVMGASVLANIVPSPDKAETGIGRVFSKIVHFIAFDIVTAKK